MYKSSVVFVGVGYLSTYGTEDEGWGIIDAGKGH
jgi:uncharacterized membrane protein